MNHLLKHLKCLCSVILLASQLCGQDWHRLVPMKSSRADVEGLLGKGNAGFASIYELRDGVLYVEYSTGPCSEIKPSGWDAPVDTVVSFSFKSRRKLRVSDLRINRKSFTLIKDPVAGGVDYLVNKHLGITYQIQLGEIDNVEYFPSSKFDHLKCENRNAL
jgi:hypothetical protein